jgi:uncharacterized secreted protein with C-terminal beta-propeller domain
MKLRCKKTQGLSVDSKIHEGEWYKVTKHKGWDCPEIVGLGCDGYSWIEWDEEGVHRPSIDRNFCSMWNYFDNPVEIRENKINQILYEH